MEKNIDKSNIPDKREVLNNTFIFSEADDNSLDEISKALIELKVKKYNNIIKKGDKGNAMYVIAKGKVKVHDGNHILSRLEQGAVFGEYSLIDEETRSASVTAEEDVTLYKLEQEDFYSITEKKPLINKDILKVMISRMRAMNILEEKLAKNYIRIAKQNQEIEEQNINNKKQKQKLEEQNFDLINLNEEKNHLISVVVHGLRNPLTSSLCLTELLKSDFDNLNKDQQESIEIINNSLHRINKMINEFLDVNKIESKIFKLKLKKINLSKNIKQVHKNFIHIIGKKDLKFELDLKPLFAKLNEVFFVQIVDNLITNAIRFSPHSGKILIKLFAQNENVRLEISDEGPGIPKDKQVELFKENNQGGKKKNNLGLSIVKKYVTAMNGKVRYETKEGEGSKFIVEFKNFIDSPDYE